jgi:hypothetical protein
VGENLSEVEFDQGLGGHRRLKYLILALSQIDYSLGRSKSVVSWSRLSS